MGKYLPIVRAKNHESRIKQSLRLRLKGFLRFLSSLASKGGLLHTYPLALSRPKQNGFAIIPVLLLLFGIAAGTLLVQNGTSFLPKAQESLESATAIDPDRFGPCQNYSYFKIGQRYGPPIIKNGCTVNRIITSMTNNLDNKCVIDYQEQYDNNPSCPFFNPGTQTATKEYCTLHGIRNPGSDTDVVIEKYQTWSGCDTNRNKVLYLCLGSNQLSVDVKERSSSECGATAPAAQPAPQQSNTVWDCSEAIKSAGFDLEKMSKEKSACYDKGQRAKVSHCEHIEKSSGKAYNTLKVVDESTKQSCINFIKKDPLPGYTNKRYCSWDPAQCSATAPAAQSAPASYSSSQLQKCSDDDLKKCPTANKGCYIINDRKRCVFDKITCAPDETPYCQRGEDKRQGCEVKDIKIDDQPLQHTQCTEAKLNTTAPAAGGPAANQRPATAPQTGTQPRPAPDAAPRGAQSQGATPGTAAAPQPAAPLICGKDKDGLDIPCYSIGVFSPSELTSRESQAKIASINYEKFRTILRDEEARINAEVKSNAERTIKEAEEALKMCPK